MLWNQSTDLEMRNPGIKLTAWKSWVLIMYNHMHTDIHGENVTAGGRFALTLHIRVRGCGVSPSSPVLFTKLDPSSKVKQSSCKAWQQH